jgi:microcystin-dependent protein
MPQDASGTPTPNFSFPTYNTAVDRPSGLGLNAIIQDIDSKLASSSTLLGAVARSIIAKAGGVVGTRRKLNFIEGTGITITASDDSANEKVDITIAASGSGIPTGTVIPYAGSTAPSGYLICNGSAVSRTTYSNLFSVIGTTYGAGDGSTTFNLPDLRGRVVVGLGTHVDVDALGDNEGMTTVSNRRPRHYHTTVVANTAGTGLSGSAGGVRGDAAASYNTDLGATNNIKDTPAYLVLNYIIKT